MKKRVTSIFIIMVMILSFIPILPAQRAEAVTTINVGDYVAMGNYGGNKLRWKCVAIDPTNGPLMLLDSSIPNKSFDVAGANHKYLDGTPQADSSDYRTKYGSNLWETSTMRSWLNSTSPTAGGITWLDSVTPGVGSGYTGEAGFLSNFTTTEISAIKSVSQKSLLNDIDINLKTGGTAGNYYDMVTDQMFLLDTTQVTAMGVITYADGSYCWTRSPCADYSISSYVYFAKLDGFFYGGSSSNTGFGARPAFYIDLSSVIFKSGNGTLATPYSINSTVATLTSGSYTVSAGGTANETISNVPAGTTNAAFQGALIKGEANQTWNVTGLSDPVVTGDKIIVTAEDGVTKVTYDVTVNAVILIAPTATTNAGSSITSAGATLNGTVNANNASTVVSFEYGLTTSYGNLIAADQNPLTGTSNTAVSSVLTGLTSNVRYHYRVVGVNTAGTTYGLDQTFTTLALAPTINTQPNSTTVIAGDATSFSVLAAGDSPLIYQWQVNAGSGFTYISDTGVYSGANTATLSITGSTAGMNGYVYQVTVTGIVAPAVTSNSATLTVNSVAQNTLLALGDSISYGMSATPGNGYVDLLFNHLKTADNNLTLNNLSVSGYTSSALLSKLQDPTYLAAIKNAKIITVSVGGDNLLSPVIAAVCTGFGVNPSSPNFMYDLATAMASNPNKDAILASIASSPTLASGLQAGVVQFATDLPQIINTLKMNSPQSQIYVLNLYNPFASTDPLYALFDPIINGINANIEAFKPIGNYKVADVYNKFKATTGAVNFSLSAMQLDPHPTTVGHAAIYQAILDAEAGLAYYKVNIGTLTGGSITATPTTATSGSAITLTITPASGKQLQTGSLKYNDGTQDVVITGTSFIMPAANVRVSAVFEAVPANTYTVNIGTLTGGTITATPTTATSGSAITLTITPASGKQLQTGSLKYNDGTQDVVITGTSFIMPAANVRVSAVFEAVPANTYTVNIGTLTGGTITATPTTGTSGSAITLTITPASGKQLQTGSLKYNDGTQDVAISGTSFIMPAKNVTVSAVFEVIPATGGGSSSSSGESTSNSATTTTAATTTISANIIDNKTKLSITSIPAQVFTETDGTKTVTMNSSDVAVLKGSNGEKSTLTDLSKLGFSTPTTTTGTTNGATRSVSVVIGKDGTISVKGLANDTESKFDVTYDLGNGMKITIGYFDIKVSSSGVVTLSCILIDPYGIITDEATGKVIDGVNVTLYYANTARNKAAGKTPDTVVELPLIDGFKPNNNKDPQTSDASGAYGFMVFPVSDYYLVGTKDGYMNYTSPTISVEQEIVKWNFAMHVNGGERLSGQSRVDTSIAISKATYQNTLSNVILATSENYPDALAGSVLAYKFNAPILLIGNSSEDQTKVLDYLKSNLDNTGKVYILGGSTVVSTDMETKITALGFSNIIRLAGADRFETAVKIADTIGIKEGTPIVLVAGENYADALSISSVAAVNQYPIFIVAKDGISDLVKNEISTIKPSKVFIIGSQGAISTLVEDQVSQVGTVDKENIVRIGGTDRFETSLLVAKYFKLTGNITCIATGNDFPDALAGSVYAAKNNAHIILVDKALTESEIEYLQSEKISGATIFGGESVVNKDIEEQLNKILSK